MDNTTFEPTRRQVVAGLGALGMAAGLSAVKEASAQEISATADESASADKPTHEWLAEYGQPLYELDRTDAAPAVAAGYVPNMGIRNEKAFIRKDEVLEQLLQEPEPEGDLTLPNGTVVPAIYVKLRNHLNRVGMGCGSEVTETSFDMYTYLWSEQDAEYTCKIPLYRWINAWDYSFIIDKTTQEAEDILYDLADRGLITRTTRGGKNYYALMPMIAGYWEATMMKAWYENNEDSHAIVPILAANGMGKDYEFEITNNEFSALTACPVSVDVVAEDEIMPYFDWRERIRRENFVAVAGCECMVLWEGLADVDMRDRFPMKRCLYLGEIGEYFVSIGAAEQITPDEAIAIGEQAIDAGMVIEFQTGTDGDIFCMCHTDVCLGLRSYKAMQGHNPVAMKNYSIYNLQYDPDKCIGCGACIERCPMRAIVLDDDNKCVHADICVRCGQCVTVCPVDARILKARDDYPIEDMPYDYEIDFQEFFAKQRWQRGTLYDFTGTTIPGADYGVVTDSATRTSL